MSVFIDLTCSLDANTVDRVMKMKGRLFICFVFFFIKKLSYVARHRCESRDPSITYVCKQTKPGIIRART